jgi:tetratricopeptide (TPR) repeat protein
MSKIANLKKKVAEIEKKQPDKAIPVYVELLAEMEKNVEEMDVALFNRAGDLMLKLGKVGDAVDCYERAVDHYAEGGFFNNAIALCNKILRSSPGRATVYYKLGKISAHKGFKADAKQNFLEYADRMQKAGKLDEAFRALAEFADLCPDQTDIRLSLADQLFKAGRKNDAMEQLQVLHEQLVSEGRAGEAQAAIERMKAIDPAVEPRSGGGSRSQGKSGDLVFLDLGDTSAAKDRRASIIAKRATQGLKVIDIDEPPPRPKVAPPAPKVAPPAPKAAPSPPPPPPPEADVSPPMMIDSMMPEIGESTMPSGSLLGLESTSLGDLGVSSSPGGTIDFGSGSLLEPTPPGTDAVSDLSDEGTLDFIMPDGAEVPPAPPVRSSIPMALVEDALDIQLEPELAAPEPDGVADLPIIEPELEEYTITQEPALDLGRPSSLLAPQSLEVLQAAVEGDPEDWGSHRALAEAMLEAGNREGGVRELEAAMLGYERSGDLTTAMSVADEIVRIDPSSVKHHQKRVEYAYRTSDKGLLVESYLALADALFRGGQVDKSRSIYQRVLELSPDDARAQAALSAIPDVAPEPPPPPKDRRSVKDTRKSSIKPAPQVETRKPLSPQADDSFVNLGEWLREDAAPKDTRMVVAEEEPSGDEEADFADMLRKFKAGVAENVDEEDYQSHYDLGVAYKEMGLVDEAIAEFQKALRAPDGRTRTYEAIGQCFLEKDQHQMAATILGRALSEKGMDDDQLVGVLYLMGRANEALGRGDEAMQYYQRVFVVDIEFRDVADRLSALENAAQ